MGLKRGMSENFDVVDVVERAKWARDRWGGVTPATVELMKLETLVEIVNAIQALSEEVHNLQQTLVAKD